MNTNDILNKLSEGTILEGPYWTEPVRVLTAKARGGRVEVQAVGTHTQKLWKKLLKPEEFDGSINITQAGQLAALDGSDLDALLFLRKALPVLQQCGMEFHQNAVAMRILELDRKKSASASGTSAEEWFHKQQVHDPKRMAHLVLPISF